MTDEQIDAGLLHPASRDDQENAYAAAQNRIARLAQTRGRQTVLEWISAGIPADVSAGAAQ
jgi:hypothetical protein